MTTLLATKRLVFCRIDTVERVKITRFTANRVGKEINLSLLKNYHAIIVLHMENIFTERAHLMFPNGGVQKLLALYISYFL